MHKINKYMNQKKLVKVWTKVLLNSSYGFPPVPVVEMMYDENKALQITEDGKKNLIGSIRRRKIIDFLIKNAKIVEEEKNDTGEDKKKKLLLPGNNKPDVKNSDKKLWTPSKKNEKE